MPALNFVKEFVPPVELGLREPDNGKAKRQSIRARRKDGRDPRPGQMLCLYTGMRTKVCRKLGEAICKSVDDILITQGGGVAVAGRWLTHQDIRLLALANDFRSVEDFREFFASAHGLPFMGKLIKW